MAKLSWEKLRPEIDEAIRAGLTANEFMEMQGINRQQWYAMKPKGFHWSSVQTKLGIDKKVKPKPKSKPKSKPLKKSFYEQRMLELALDLHSSISKHGHTPKAHEVIDELYDLNAFIVNRKTKK